MHSLSGSSIFITGGTGTFGRKFVEFALRNHSPRELIVFSRDEQKQYDMRMEGFTDPRLHFFVGDVRDRESLVRAMCGVDFVVHAAALKHIQSCENNPFEAVQTNIIGSRNVIEASLDAGVQKVLAIGTDKSVHPISLYGATKLVAEKLFTRGNVYNGTSDTRFSCIRYGNFIGSRGSVVPLFISQRNSGTITVTDNRMTRFWITIEQGVQFALQCLEQMQGGEIFVPKMPSMRIMDLAKAIAPNCRITLNGRHPGEKLHENLISENEAHNTIDAGNMFIIQPENTAQIRTEAQCGTLLPDDFQYTSDSNEEWLSIEDFQSLLADMENGILPDFSHSTSSKMPLTVGDK